MLRRASTTVGAAIDVLCAVRHRREQQWYSAENSDVLSAAVDQAVYVYQPAR